MLITVMKTEISSTYATPELRAAYRAGMSTAAAICDVKAATVAKINPGRKRGEASQVGEFGVEIARQCGNDIMAARDMIKVHETTE